MDEWESVLTEFRQGGRLEGRWGFLEMLTKLSGPGEWITGPSSMARLYATKGGRSAGYALPGDELLMTLSAGKENGQWTLLEHLADGSTRPISLFDVGQLGDVWVGSNGREWTHLGSVDYGHGFLVGEPGHVYVTFAPDRFDKWSPGLDLLGIATDAWGHPIGKVAGKVADVVSLYRGGWRLVQDVRGGASREEVSLAVADFGLDLAGFQWDFVPDIASLLLNVVTSTSIDWGR